MNKVFALVAMLALGATAPAWAQQSQHGSGTSPAPVSSEGATAAAALVSRLQPLIGKEQEGGVFITAARAEGDTVIITVNGSKGWDGASPQLISDSFIGGFCGSPAGRAFFDKSWLRIDSLERGVNYRVGPRTNTCPAK